MILYVFDNNKKFKFIIFIKINIFLAFLLFYIIKRIRFIKIYYNYLNNYKNFIIT